MRLFPPSCWNWTGFVKQGQECLSRSGSVESQALLALSFPKEQQEHDRRGVLACAIPVTNPRTFLSCHVSPLSTSSVNSLSALARTLLDKAEMVALTRVARGMAKKTPQNPHSPPKVRMAAMMATG